MARQRQTPTREKLMPRPCIRRRIRGRPNASYFKPAGIPASQLEEATLSLDEFEALRLIDSRGTNQSEAAKSMNISQPTLSRILSTARRKLAHAICNGQAIKIKKRKTTLT